MAELADQELVQEYRLLAFPTNLGAGHGLFQGRRKPTLVSSEHIGPAVSAVLTPDPQERPITFFITYDHPARDPPAFDRQYREVHQPLTVRCRAS